MKGGKKKGEHKRRKERKERREKGEELTGQARPAQRWRRRPTKRAAARSPKEDVQVQFKMEFLELLKWDFKQRSSSSLERALREEKDGVIAGGRGGIGGVRNGGEALEVNGFMVEKRQVNGIIVVVCCCQNGEGDGGKDGGEVDQSRAAGKGGQGQHCCWFHRCVSVMKKMKRLMNEGERENDGVYIYV